MTKCKEMGVGLGKAAQRSHAPAILGIAIIGAGFAGVAAAINLLKKGNADFRVFEKSDGIGGAWYESRYPGAACDIPSHFYCYSFEPNPEWSRVYSPQSEIQAYIENCVDKYGVRPFIEHGKTVKAIRLNQATGLWNVAFADGSQIRSRHIINCSGGLHKPAIPEFPGQEKFTGATMHSAKWNHQYDMANKNVLVIGSAASAIQIVPELAKIAKTVTICQRTPNYISRRGDRNYSKFEKALFRYIPLIGRLHRWSIFMTLELMMFPIIKRGSSFGKRAAAYTIGLMEQQVKDKALVEALRPKYDMGCKRILVSDDFYQTLNLSHVELLTSGIAQLEADCVALADGTRREVDVIVYATGYDLEGHQRSVEIVGRDGIVLSDLWKDGAEAYNGTAVAGFPNFYFLGGPNTGVGTTSYVYMIEVLLNYILKCIDLAGPKGLLNVKQEVQDAYNSQLQIDLQGTVWAGDCKSWYKRESGKIDSLYPNNARTFRRQLSKVNRRDFEFKRLG